MKHLDWIWHGRYGDSKSENVHVEKHPEDLSLKLQNQLVKEYSRQSGEHSYEFEELGLARQAGNAWNHISVWAPVVHMWMKKPNINDLITRQVQEQYK
jgi:hypothetical protein